MSILDGLIGVTAWSVIIIPVSVLVVGLVLSYFMRSHRQTIGILLISLGSMGAIIISSCLYVASINFPETIFAFAGLLSIEIATILTGALVLSRRLNVRNNRLLQRE